MDPDFIRETTRDSVITGASSRENLFDGFMNMQNSNPFLLLRSYQEVRKLSRVIRKPTFWFPTWSDTNQAVQLQKMARGLKFRI